MAAGDFKPSNTAKLSPHHLAMYTRASNVFIIAS